MNTQRHCLIVDDDREDIDIFSTCIRTIDESVTTTGFYNGVEALAHLSKTDYTPDFIFLDVIMPMIGGWELLDKMQKIDKLSKAKFILFSTSEFALKLPGAKGTEGVQFIVKPSTNNEIIEQLSAILKS